MMVKTPLTGRENSAYLEKPKMVEKGNGEAGKESSSPAYSIAVSWATSASEFGLREQNKNQRKIDFVLLAKMLAKIKGSFKQLLFTKVNFLVTIFRDTKCYGWAEYIYHTFYKLVIWNDW